MSYILTTILDSLSGRTMTVVYNPSDRLELDRHWEASDVLLQELQTIEAFRHRTRWCDLTPTHLKFLLTRNVERVFALLQSKEATELSSDELNYHDTINSMNFLIMAYARAYETAVDCTIEMIRITRHGLNEITLWVGSSVDSNFKNMKGRPNDRAPAFKMITKDEE